MNEYRWRRRERSSELHGGSPGSQSMAAWLGFVKKRANSVDCNSADRQANQTKNLSS